MINLALIYDNNSSDWKSCNSILENIVSSYVLANCDVTHIVKTTNGITKEIVTNKVTHIAYVDHRVLPGPELDELIRALDSDKLPSLIIHVYGDFILNLSEWKQIERTLKKFKTKFICASSAHANLLKQLIKTESLVNLTPFPVNSRFKYINQIRENFRSKNLILNNEIVLCYTGRISLQKNVLHILSLFSTLYYFIPDIKLLIAGTFDDIGVPYLGLARLPLTMEVEFYQLLENFSPEIKERILYLGNLNQDELVELYNGSDFYISLSTHNDEDFGMSPAEAICCGLPLILTDWGGFKDFKKKFSENIVTVKTQLTPLGYKPEVTKTHIALLRFITKFTSNASNDRNNRSNSANSVYFPQAIKNSYNKLIEEQFYNFSGFTSILNKTNTNFQRRKYFKSKINIFDSTYDKLYSEYK